MLIFVAFIAILLFTIALSIGISNLRQTSGNEDIKSVYLSSYLSFVSLISLIIIVFFLSYRNDGASFEIGILIAIAYSVGATIIGFIPLLLFCAIQQEIIRYQRSSILSSMFCAFFISLLFMVVIVIITRFSFDEYLYGFYLVLLHAIPVSIIIQRICGRVI